jgi:hypothetical protein
MLVILATQEAEIRRIKVWSQPGQIVLRNLSWKYPSQKRADGVAQGEDPEFKSHYHKNKQTIKKPQLLWLNSYVGWDVVQISSPNL